MFAEILVYFAFSRRIILSSGYWMFLFSKKITIPVCIYDFFWPSWSILWLINWFDWYELKTFCRQSSRVWYRSLLTSTISPNQIARSQLANQGAWIIVTHKRPIQTFLLFKKITPWSALGYRAFLVRCGDYGCVGKPARQTWTFVYPLKFYFFSKNRQNSASSPTPRSRPCKTAPWRHYLSWMTHISMK